MPDTDNPVKPAPLACGAGLVSQMAAGYSSTSSFFANFCTSLDRASAASLKRSYDSTSAPWKVNVSRRSGRVSTWV